MDSVLKKDIQDAVKAMQQGLLIAYPTESVYGLGCDPKQPAALEKLIQVKQRNPEKGLILIASRFEQLRPYLDEIDDVSAARAKKTWPGAVTWVWPVNKESFISPLLTGKHQSIAVRVTNHPIAAALCEAFQSAVVSTSANLEGKPPAKSAQEVRSYFTEPDQVAKIVDGALGDLLQPTPIYDVITQVELR